MFCPELLCYRMIRWHVFGKGMLLKEQIISRYRHRANHIRIGYPAPHIQLLPALMIPCPVPEHIINRFTLIHGLSLGDKGILLAFCRYGDQRQHLIPLREIGVNNIPETQTKAAIELLIAIQTFSGMYRASKAEGAAGEILSLRDIGCSIEMYGIEPSLYRLACRMLCHVNRNAGLLQFLKVNIDNDHLVGILSRLQDLPTQVNDEISHSFVRFKVDVYQTLFPVLIIGPYNLIRCIRNPLINSIPYTLEVLKPRMG